MQRTVLVLLTILSTAAFSQEKNLHIIVDERDELMTMVELICESPVMTLTSADLGYAREVTERFGRFNHHPAVAYETLNRANEVMLTSDILGKEEGDALYATYISKRYEYLSLCMDVLKIYRANRETYRSLQDIKPLLLRAFENKVKQVCH
jgi:hypothetical protein